MTTLEAAVKAIHPTILIGTSTRGGAFTEAIVREMASHTWTEGRALVATGIPSKPVVYNGTTYHIGQANNALIYPGLGLGVIASGARLVTDRMISVAAHSMGGIVDPSAPGAAVLPPVMKVNLFSDTVAEAVAEEAKAEGAVKTSHRFYGSFFIPASLLPGFSVKAGRGWKGKRRSAVEEEACHQ